MDNAFLNISIFIFINFLLFYSWYILLFRERHSLLFTDRLIGAFVLGLTQIISTEMLLGLLFKKLFAGPLLLLNISISLAVLAAAIISGRTDNSPGGNIVHELQEELFGVLGIIKKDGILFCISVLFLISVCWMVFTGYIFPSYTWDALWYHLPIVGYIMQSGAIQENATPFTIDLFINILPKNIELFFLWNIIFLESDVIVDLSQLFFTIAGILTIYSMALKLGVKKEHALYAAFLFFFTPVVILQSTTNYVDIAVSVLFLISINFLMCDNSTKTSVSMETHGDPKAGKVRFLLSGLAAGILLGSKASGPLFILVLSGIFLLQEILKRLDPFNLISGKFKEYFGKGSFLVFIYCFLIPAFLIGGYWYVKNWLLYSNPVYPIEVSFFDVTLFKGLFEGIIDPLPPALSGLSSIHSLFHVWLEKVGYYLYDSRLSGFGPLWFILLLPSFVTAFFYSLKDRRYSFLFIFIVIITVFILHPRNWYTRYVIFVLALGSMSFAITLEYFSERQKIIKTIAFLLVIYTFLTANSPCITPGKVLEFTRLPFKDRIIARHAPFNIDLQARQEYGLWIWVSNNMTGKNTLAFASEPLFLAPLWNGSFSNKVVYIKSSSYNEWIKRLRDNNVSHVLVRRNSTEDKWIDDVTRLLYNIPGWLNASKRVSERFKVVYSDDNYKVFSLNTAGT